MKFTDEQYRDAGQNIYHAAVDGPAQKESIKFADILAAEQAA